MCGRFTLTSPDVHALALELAARVDTETARLHRPRWNVAPTQTHPVLRLDGGTRLLVQARFGVERRWGGLVINARSETAAELPTFRDAYQSSRCVVPADGFYEWQGGRGDRRPLWFHDPAGGLLYFAGLCFENGAIPAFVILTTPANATMAPVHDRMPALLSRDAAESWLARSDASLLAPAPEGALIAREVSVLVNGVENDGPELLGAPAPPRQLRLV